MDGRPVKLSAAQVSDLYGSASRDSLSSSAFWLALAILFVGVAMIWGLGA